MSLKCGERVEYNRGLLDDPLKALVGSFRETFSLHQHRPLQVLSKYTYVSSFQSLHEYTYGMSDISNLIVKCFTLFRFLCSFVSVKGGRLSVRTGTGGRAGRGYAAGAAAGGGKTGARCGSKYSSSRPAVGATVAR